MMLDVLTNLVAILVRHDHVGDHHVRRLQLDLGKSGGCIMARDHVDVLAAAGDLDHLPHGRGIVNEINGWGGVHYRGPPSATSCSPSSNSRNASSISSVEERITVR